MAHPITHGIAIQMVCDVSPQKSYTYEWLTEVCVTFTQHNPPALFQVGVGRGWALPPPIPITICHVASYLKLTLSHMVSSSCATSLLRPMTHSRKVMVRRSVCDGDFDVGTAEFENVSW